MKKNSEFYIAFLRNNSRIINLTILKKIVKNLIQQTMILLRFVEVLRVCEVLKLSINEHFTLINNRPIWQVVRPLDTIFIDHRMRNKFRIGNNCQKF